MAKTSAQKAQENAVKNLLGIAHFQYLVEAIFENAINAVGNTGQAFILVELKQKCIDPMIKIIAGSKRQPGKGFFRSLFFVTIGDEKYNAVSKIIEEMIEQLIEAWDDSTLQDDRTQIRMFLKTSPEDYLTNTPSPEGQMWAARARMVRGLL
jgi:hypothetical protein